MWSRLRIEVPRLSIRVRYLTALVSFCVLGPAVIIMLRDSYWLYIALIAMLLAAGGYTTSLRCPVCRSPIGLKSDGEWALSPPRKCRNCGRDLDVPSPSVK